MAPYMVIYNFLFKWVNVYHHAIHVYVDGQSSNSDLLYPPGGVHSMLKLGTT